MRRILALVAFSVLLLSCRGGLDVPSVGSQGTATASPRWLELPGTSATDGLDFFHRSCTIGGKPAVIEPGTWVYFLRWKDTYDFAEIMTEDGRIALLAFTEEYDETRDMHSYCIDGVDAEDYFDNLCMAG